MGVLNFAATRAALTLTLAGKIGMDPIADMLTRIRNAQAVGHATASVSFSKLKAAIADLLKREGFIAGAERRGKKIRKELEMRLLYHDGAPAISGSRRVSRLGKRVYRGWRELRPVRQGYGIAIVSTPRGLLTDREARKLKVGGEVLLEVW